jgi:hypothetical protein
VNEAERLIVFDDVAIGTREREHCRQCFISGIEPFIEYFGLEQRSREM